MNADKITLKSGKEVLVLISNNEELINIEIYFKNIFPPYYSESESSKIFSYLGNGYQNKKKAIWNLQYDKWNTSISVEEKEELIDYIVNNKIEIYTENNKSMSKTIIVDNLNFFRSYVALIMLYITTFIHRFSLGITQNLADTFQETIFNTGISITFLFSLFLLCRDFVKLILSKNFNDKLWIKFVPILLILSAWIYFFDNYLDSIAMTFFAFIAAIFSPLTLILAVLVLFIYSRSKADQK